MVRITKTDKRKLKELSNIYTENETKKIRGFLMTGYTLKEAIKKRLE